MSLPSIGFSLYPEEIRPVSTFHSVGTTSYPNVIPAKSPFLASPAPTGGDRPEASASPFGSSASASASPFGSSPFASSSSAANIPTFASASTVSNTTSLASSPVFASSTADASGQSQKHAVAALNAKIHALELQLIKSNNTLEDLCSRFSNFEKTITERLESCETGFKQAVYNLAEDVDAVIERIDALDLESVVERIDNLEISREGLFDGCCDDPLFSKSSNLLNLSDLCQVDNNACYFRNEYVPEDGASETKEHAGDEDEDEEEDADAVEENSGEEHEDSDDVHAENSDEDDNIHGEDDFEEDEEDNAEDAEDNDNDYTSPALSPLRVEVEGEGEGHADVNDTVSVDFSATAHALTSEQSKIRTITFIKPSKATPGGTAAAPAITTETKEAVIERLRGKSERDVTKLRVSELADMLLAFGDIYAPPKQDAVKLLMRRVAAQQEMA